MDMQLPQTPLEGATGLYYAVLYGIISFLLVLVAILLFYVACSKRYRLNWFERNLLETADESRELANSNDALLSADGRPLLREEKIWVPVGKQSLQDVLETSDEDGDPAGSPSTSRGSKTSLAVDGTRTSGDEAVPIARNDKQIVLTSKPLVSMNARLDLSKIDATLYQQPVRGSEDQMEEVRGQVHLSIAFDSAAGMLSVRLIEAQNLRARDFSGTADPYAKIRLLPDRNNVWQTRIHKKTLNPVFDEDFVFEAKALTLGRRTLEIILYDFDAYSRHYTIGGLKLSLEGLDVTDEKLTLCKDLTPCNHADSKDDLGDLLVSLSFLPSAERLTVVVMKARNLRIVDDSRASSDPFVKVTLLQGGKRIKKKKTSIHRNSVNPTFNERLTFDVSRDMMSKVSLELCVYHDGKLGPCELLGRSLLGSSSSCRPEDREFFHELLTNKSANAKWLVLTHPS